jgi:hypothetical protein
MSTQSIIFIIAIVMILVIAVTQLRAGPRITPIDRTTRREKKDVPEDRGDA